MSKRKPRVITPPTLPPPPPPTDREILANQQLVTKLQDLVAMLRQRSLNRAVSLAQQAACGHGPLVEHFVELGNRYAKLLDAPQKPALRVVKGGAE